MKRTKILIIGLMGVGLTLPVAIAQQSGQSDPSGQNQLYRAQQDKNQQNPGLESQNKSLHQSRQGAMASSHIQASQFIGQKVRSAAGEELGEVKDVIFDLNSGRAPVVVLSYGGTLGVGATRVAVPINQLHCGSQGQLTMDVTRQQLDSASRMATGSWNAIAQEDWARQVNRFYGEPNWSMRSYDRESLSPDQTRQPVREYEGQYEGGRPDQLNPQPTSPSPFENEGKGAPRLKEHDESYQPPR